MCRGITETSSNIVSGVFSWPRRRSGFDGNSGAARTPEAHGSQRKGRKMAMAANQTSEVFMIGAVVAVVFVVVIGYIRLKALFQPDPEDDED